MSNLLDYLDWRADVTLDGSAFNEIDNIILAMSTFVDFSGIVPDDPAAGTVGFDEAMKQFDALPEKRDYLGVLIPSSLLDIARRAVGCPRYNKIRLAGYVNEVDESEEMQFSSLTFILPTGEIYIGFRGTDDSIIGWKEDLMLGFKTPVPAHIRSEKYLTDVAAAFPDAPILLGGHSKGGNVAMWAGSHVDMSIRDRVRLIYNNDGPGFMPDIVNGEEYRSVADRIITFIPQSSIVGAMLEQSPNHIIIKSNEKGILQHDPLSWEVLGAKFVYLEKRSKFGENSDENIKKWVYSMNEEERAHFASILFEVIDSTGAHTLTDLSEAKMKNLNVILKTLRGLDKESRDMILHALVRLLGGK